MNYPRYVFYGPYKKLYRADEHLHCLYKRIDRFIKDKPYKTWTEPDLNTGEIVIYGEPVKEPPSVEFGVLIGDVVHNLRSSLDNLVWELACARSGPPPPNPIPRTSYWRDVGFPVVRQPEHWSDAFKKIALTGSEYVTPFHTSQPFYTRPDAPEREPLAILEELWNIDKHRYVHLTTAMVRFESAKHVRGWPFDPTNQLRIIQQRAPGPIESHTELGRIVPIGPLTQPLSEMRVRPRFRFDVAFEQGAPAYGAGVGETLRSIYDSVTTILIKFSQAG